MKCQRISLEVRRDDQYEILIGEGILKYIGFHLRSSIPNSKQVVILTDGNVCELYADSLVKNLAKEGFDAKVLMVPPGEKSKSLEIAAELWEKLASLEFRRRSVILALGGGVITDLAGFVAAGYMRGVQYINVPTTLVAQLDAAIGGKVGVNHESAKNLIGFFHHPSAVYVDPEMLKTLPVDEIRHGLSEAIKVAIVGSRQLFDFIEGHVSSVFDNDMESLTQVIELAARAKIKLLSPDIYEHDLKRALNFGHTIGHALEAVLSYSIAHGDAVAIGMATATRISCARGFCTSEVFRRIINLISRVGLPTVASDGSPSQVWQALSIIRAIRDNHFHEVLPTDIGQYVFYDSLSENDLAYHMYSGDLK